MTDSPPSSLIAPATRATLERAATLLRAGELVAFPTETVYGLGADAANPAAVAKIFAAKGRPANHPVIVHVAAAEDFAFWAREIPAAASKLIARFCPGPLTLILPRAAHVSDAVTGGQDSVGIRMPSHPVARRLLQAFAAQGGRGIAAPSANRFGHVSPTTAQHVADDLEDRVAMIVDGGSCEHGIESTIIALTGDAPLLLRPGSLPLIALEATLGVPLRHPDRSRAAADTADGSATPRAPGTLASHYAPRTPAELVNAETLAAVSSRYHREGKRVAALLRTAHAPERAAHTLIAPVDVSGYAHMLYAALRALDAHGDDVLLIEDVPASAEWLAVRDRLLKATYQEIRN
ncbi:MAG: threonylcarbamoyl-AMP synthase [Burkholderiales bacterium]|jgi:L-threonylcarbamoyladenylate synthase|nr:threonylcarbamoyl-AMP synthase [Burkholderiales bacterium]